MDRSSNILTLLTAVIALTQCKPFDHQTDIKQAESNRYVDCLAARIRTDQRMGKFDPLKLPFHRHDMLEGHFTLSNGTATGLSTLDRHGDCEAHLDQFEQGLTIKAVLKTNPVEVCTHLVATSNKGKQVERQIYGTIKDLNVHVELYVSMDGTVKLVNATHDSIYIEPLGSSGNDLNDADLDAIVHDALYYILSVRYASYIREAVLPDLNVKGKIHQFVSKTKFPIIG